MAALQVCQHVRTCFGSALQPALERGVDGWIASALDPWLGGGAGREGDHARAGVHVALQCAAVVQCAILVQDRVYAS